MASVYTYRPTQEVEEFIEFSRKENRRSAQAEIQLLLEYAIREKTRKRKNKKDHPERDALHLGSGNTE